MSNEAHVKLAPHQSLTPEQETLVQHIHHFITSHITDEQPAIFVIHGDAGTGKSVILSEVFYQLQQARRNPDSPLYQTTNYFLVNHPELLKVYRQIAGELPQELKKDFQRPTSLINQCHKHQTGFDVGVIDEAHLLLSQPDHYNNFYGQNQLLELIKLAKVLIIVFDERQVLRLKTYWTKARLQQLLAPYHQEWFHLTTQFRMQADDQVINWIDHFTGDQRLLPITPSFFNNYDFRVFDDAEIMRQAIVHQNNQVGLSRVVATTGYPSTLDGGKHYIHEGRFKLPWDQYNYTVTPWAEIPETINEVGSIYTCQGFDLNYVGLILGPPITLAADQQHLQIDPTKITDVEAFKKRDDLTDPNELNHAKITLVLNAINVLMKRGVRGLYLFAHDKQLRTVLTAMYTNAIKD
ncbi:DUF2075 domain-containing protein [Secundilactobacillus similis]|uniref:DUF2075 domain-containing protein n=1 Tax=Secundilactobacillus similis TaxID=414682 RepID=UPI0006D0696A|nr:DUF2075 domain-containing protein [Secundilactobacillus similis]